MIDAYNTTWEPIEKDKDAEMSTAENKAIVEKNTAFAKLAYKREAEAKKRQANNQDVKEGLIW
jgi:hypothetical protein